MSMFANRKGMTFAMIASVVIAFSACLVFLWVFQFQEFGEVKEAALSADDLIDFGQEELVGVEATLTSEQNREFSRLTSAIDVMKEDSLGGGCFMQYSGFEEFGEKGVSFEMRYDSKEDLSVLTIMGGEGGKQIVDRLVFEDVRPCVIAGSSEIVSSFYSSLLDPDTRGEDSSIFGQHYMPADAFIVAYDTSGFNENRINFNGEFLDFEGEKWIYTPDSKHICFFPTVDGNWACDGSSADGLDDDCLTDIDEEDTIPYLAARNDIRFCSDGDVDGSASGENEVIS